MAPWLKIRCDLHEDEAVIAAAMHLATTENEIVGALVKFWSWANRQTSNGHAKGVTKAWLDRYVSLPGFSDALCASHWLDVHPDGIAVPRFERHNGECAKLRAQSSIRSETYRAKAGAASRTRHATTVTETSPPRDGMRDQRKRKRKSKNKIEDNTPPTPLSGGVEFGRFWEAYPRKEAKQAAQKAFAKLPPSPDLLDAILAAIVRQQAAGCLEPRSTPDGRSTIPHAATWLNGRRWEDAPPAPPLTPPSGKKTFDQLFAENEARFPHLKAQQGKEARNDVV